MEAPLVDAQQAASEVRGPRFCRQLQNRGAAGRDSCASRRRLTAGHGRKRLQGSDVDGVVEKLDVTIAAGADYAASAGASLVQGNDLNDVSLWLSRPTLVADVQGWLGAPSTIRSADMHQADRTGT
ncbi:MAG: hypothetical protein HYX69_02295 [Planctomycetia bacterium]|nr:hypothetical protein [Planctomycetia bacterium]